MVQISPGMYTAARKEWAHVGSFWYSALKLGRQFQIYTPRQG